MKIKVNDSIKVKKGTIEKTFNTDLSGWQGRVSEIYDEEFLCVDWDSETLRLMPESQIKHCEREGMAWSEMGLEISNCETTSPRDTLEQTHAMFVKIQDKYLWVHLGEQGDRIQSVLSGMSSDDDMAMFSAWKRFLETVLIFPLDAEVCEYQETGPLQCNDVVCVSEMIDHIDDSYGIIATVKFKNKHYHFQLSDLDVVDKNTKNFTPVKDYVVWFANR